MVELYTEKKTSALAKPSGKIEFGGPVAIGFSIFLFPSLLYYLFFCAVSNNGQLYGITSYSDLKHIVSFCYTNAFPTVEAASIFAVFVTWQALMYVYWPGMQVQGEPLKDGSRLDYHCSAIWSFWTTIIVELTLHSLGIFRLERILDLFGSLMSVAIIFSFLVAIFLHEYAFSHPSMINSYSGFAVQDFFLGTVLNPRIGKWLDLKMFAEVRFPWFILFNISLAVAAKEYSERGTISFPVLYLCLAYFLYANACSKGEELIVPTWDMTKENWGFMLIFWNFAGVPFSYCHSVLYLAYRKQPQSPTSWKYNLLLLTGLLFVHFIFDTCNSQKNRFRQQVSGKLKIRNAFPQWPWQTIKNPTYITTSRKSKLLTKGWYSYGKKIHYTADWIQSLLWSLVTGFESPIAYFYPAFFFIVLLHRATRDFDRCRHNYGKVWNEYCRICPYTFLPFLI